MILDGATLDPRALPSYDICIIGTGAVGLAMAYALRNSKKKIVVLESGVKNTRVDERDRWKKRWHDLLVQDLDSGLIAQDSFLDQVRKATPWPRDFYKESRTRAYGGSTNCWGGWVRPLDEYDFNQWPLKRAELYRYYEDALELVGLERETFSKFDDPDWWIGKTAEPIDVINKDDLLKNNLKTVVVQKQDEEYYLNFQTRYSWLFEETELTLIKNATALYLETKQSASTSDSPFTVGKLTVGSLKDAETPGQSFDIHARQYVLAMGGMEIPRFIRNCIPHSHGLNELVKYGLGSYYMSHPHYGAFATGRFSTPFISPEIQNFYGPPTPPGVVRLKSNPNIQIQAFIVPTENVVGKSTQNFRSSIVAADDRQSFTIEVSFEQVPTRESQLIVDPTRVDVFKKPRLQLDWQFAKDDAQTVNEASKMLNSWLSTISPTNPLQDWKSFEWNYDAKSAPYPPLKNLDNTVIYTSDHHMGMTRMNSKDGAKDGAVDSNLKALDFDNLWMCSAGVFRTGGWANATLTLLAFALRLAHQLDN